MNKDRVEGKVKDIAGRVERQAGDVGYLNKNHNPRRKTTPGGGCFAITVQLRRGENAKRLKW